jgi:LacI family transcriptional regulator
MIRLKDVAARAGVSIMTVSKVLRDAPDVSEATKARIRRLADEMGYLPDSQARGLRMRRTRLFGLILPSITDHWLAHAAAAIEERVHELNYDLLVCQTKDLPPREETCIHRLLSRRIDGLFLHPVYRLAPSAPAYEELLRSGTPTIILGHRAPFCSQFANVETEDALASFNLAEHLIKLGHERIAFLAGPSAAPWAQERLEGYRKALRSAGLQCEDRLVFTAGAGIQDGENAAGQMIAEAISATAVMAVTDHVAIGAATVFMKRGLRIPEDISIAGFGNHMAAENFRVPLTTVQQPKFGFGVVAAEQMLCLLRGDKLESMRLPCELVLRQSTARPERRLAVNV